MKNSVRTLLACVALISSTAFATVIDFESTGTPDNYNDLNYAIDGFVFNQTMDNIDISSTSIWSTNAPAHSGSFAALNNYGGAGELSRADGGTFTLNSLWLKGWSQSAITATVNGYLNGVLVEQMSVSSDNVWTMVSGTSSSIDLLRISASYYFLVDDIALNQPANVPEPASLLLVGLGLAGLCVASRKPRRNA